MREIVALIRAHWLSRTSYRLRTILGLAGMVASVVPLFFISGALQPLMADVISDEGTQYFGFVVVGMAAALLTSFTVASLPDAVAGAIDRGTFEAMLGTPAGVPQLLIGMIGAGLLMTLLRMVIFLGGGWALGASFQVTTLLPGLAIFAALILAYLPFGLLAAALVLVFRTAGPLPQLVNYLSVLLGGVYYPTHVVPSWLQNLSDVIPMTYALRALRRVVLEGVDPASVSAELGIVIGFSFALLLVAGAAFHTAFRYAKKAGTLTQY